jgi:uncharacterized membrane protein YheB (UPF0754 family)
MDDHRKLKSLKEQERKFKAYLSSLKQEELQFEANYIINKVQDENLSNEFLLKSSLLLEELAKRVDASNMANTIQKFSSNIRSKIDPETTH